MRRVLLAAVAGAATSFAFAPYGLWPLAILGPAVLFHHWRDAPPRAAARSGFAYGAALFAAGTWWIYTAVHDFGQAPAWLAVLLLAALVAIKGSYYALLGWLVTRPAGLVPAARLLLLLPSGWTLMEWLRGWLFTGFPWLQLGSAHSDSALAALAPAGGVHLLTLASAVTAGALVLALEPCWRQRATAAATALLFWGGAFAVADREWTVPAAEPFPVALLQGAIPQDEKWLAENRAETLARYRALNREALGARIIVWPESAVPMLAHDAEVYLESIRREAREHGSDVMIGLLRFDFATGEISNGLFSMSAAGDGWYFKRRLVPFGEFFPVPDAVRRWMRLMSLPYYDMTPGADDQPALAAGGERLGATICYEDAYGSEQLAVLAEATLLVNVTNNAWFGDSSAPHQQLQMSRLRAREAGRWLMRATSNGVTAVIAPDGSVAARAPQFEPAVLQATVQPRTGLTPYARTGNWPVLVLCLLMAAVGVLSGLQRRRSP
ncbi:MAG: apolipoprotein N-acyltransferase [Steroidobacteraceae bacterium]|nr:apolipoprotein N-acyltransferase [Steroidobacteraceae bacterium]